MPSNFADYAARVARAARRADADATDAQREALNHKIGKLFVHGLEISITHPAGSIRRGGPPGDRWERVVRNHYGYINKTTASDGEHLDAWLGGHPESQLVFTFDFLTPGGEHDELKAVLACRNVQEAKKVIRQNYPDGFLEDRVGEVRGYFMPQFKTWLREHAPWKAKKAASSGFWCDSCKEWHKDRTEEDGCPECEKKAQWVRFAKLADGAMMAPQPAKATAAPDLTPAPAPPAGAATAGQYKPPPPPAASPVPQGNGTLGGAAAAFGSHVGATMNAAPALPKTPPAQPVVSPPKPAAGANDDVSAMPKMYSEPGHSWLGGVNARTAPTSGTSMYRANAAPEEGVLQHLKTLPVRGVDRLNGWLHDSGDPHGRYMEALRGGENGQRPLLDEDALHNDPVSWQLFKEWAGGREFPVTQEDGDFVKNFQAPGQGPDSREVGLQNLAKYPPNFRSRPTGLTAIHEGTHYAQGRGAGGTDARTNWSELVPSLNDLPYLEEYTRRLQADRGRPVTGSGVTLTPPSGDPLSGATMHQQATEHGLFAPGDKRRSMAELLNTEAGRAWLRRQAGGAQ